VAGALPVAVWILVPKCPVCVAAHVALWTGLGLSFTQASLLRSSLLWCSGGLLLCVIARHVRRRWLARQRRGSAMNRVGACCDGLARVVD
jgi:hypothetical protein